MLIDELTAFTRTVDPASEPVTLDEAKAQLRVSDTADDSYITDLIAVARDYAENFTGRALLQQDWKATFDSGDIPSGNTIELPRPPLQSVESIAYLDTDGNSQALASSYYTVDTISQPGRILFEDLPDIKSTLAALTVTYRAGYANAAAVPAAIKHAILLMVAHFYDVREPVVMGVAPSRVPLSADTLLRQMKVRYV